MRKFDVTGDFLIKQLYYVALKINLLKVKILRIGEKDERD